MNGTIEIKTKRLLLRRYGGGDAAVLYEKFGRDPKMFEYSGWNPYATKAMAEETVADFIRHYSEPRFYGWAVDDGSGLVGTVGAYDYDPEKSQIEVGMSIAWDAWGKGFATEALTAVLHHLTGHEQIRTVIAWCAADNIGSKRAMEKAGMQLKSTESGALAIGGNQFDKLVFAYTAPAEKEKEQR